MIWKHIVRLKQFTSSDSWELLLRIQSDWVTSTKPQKSGFDFLKPYRTSQIHIWSLRTNKYPYFQKAHEGMCQIWQTMSLMFIPGKALKWNINWTVCGHFEKEAVITQSQHGFTKKRSCQVYTNHPLCPSALH